MFFPPEQLALLQEADAPGGNPLYTFALFGGMIALFYFLLIRPQSKARKALEEKLSKLKSGDEVVLTSGFYATIDRVDGATLYLKLGNNIVKARRNAVAALANEIQSNKTQGDASPSVFS
ncbi:MAG: preprotein translocase subunit YajC [Holophagales bacterium]|jgi:preprotein translocase subunit YajC|nr:preprotein translocase subunit YajC [Holophagales bacterium]